jgi:hypothetical protein
VRMRAQHSTVRFAVCDIIHPQPLEVLRELFQDHCLQGEVIATTDDGQEPGGFLVVRLPNLREPVIVPARAILSYPPPFETIRPELAPGQKNRGES